MKKRISNTKVALIYATILLAVAVFIVALGVAQNGYESKASGIIGLVVAVFFLTILLIATIREK